MGKSTIRLKKRQQAIAVLGDLVTHPDNVLIIHYGCEGFNVINEGKSPRIACIAVRHLGSLQDTAFSLHQEAELLRIPNDSIPDKYEELEKRMLKNYFDFVGQHLDYKWVHWSMRDVNYGFAALEHRYKVHGGKPPSIHPSNLYDLPRYLVAIYRYDYIGHPRLTKLMEKNNIQRPHFLTGQEECDAFIAGDYVKQYWSTLSKVVILSHIMQRAAEGSLKTDAPWYEPMGLNFEALVDILKEHWIFTLLGIIASLIAILGLIFGFGS